MVKSDGSIWFTELRIEGRRVTQLHDLVVNPSERGRGIGAAALGELEEWSRGQVHDAIVVEVGGNDTAALRFLASCGFETTGGSSALVRLERPNG